MTEELHELLEERDHDTGCYIHIEEIDRRLKILDDLRKIIPLIDGVLEDE